MGYVLRKSKAIVHGVYFHIQGMRMVSFSLYFGFLILSVFLVYACS